MNLLENKELLRGLLKQSDLINTINGGVSLTIVNVENTKEAIVIKVSAPTVPVDAFKIFLDHKDLTIYSEIQAEDNFGEGDEPLKMPLFIQTFEVPVMINTNKIEALYESGELRVILPFKDKNKIQKFVPIKSI